MLCRRVLCAPLHNNIYARVFVFLSRILVHTSRGGRNEKTRHEKSVFLVDDRRFFFWKYVKHTKGTNFKKVRKKSLDYFGRYGHFCP